MQNWGRTSAHSLLECWGDALLPHLGLIQVSRKSECLPWGTWGTWEICDIPAHLQGTHVSTGAAVFKKWGWRGFPGGPVVGDPPANAADMAQPLGWEDPTCLMATKTVPHNFWVRALKPTGHNYWFHAPQLRSLWAYSNRRPQQDKPLQ